MPLPEIERKLIGHDEYFRTAVGKSQAQSVRTSAVKPKYPYSSMKRINGVGQTVSFYKDRDTVEVLDFTGDENTDECEDIANPVNGSPDSPNGGSETASSMGEDVSLPNTMENANSSPNSLSVEPPPAQSPDTVTQVGMSVERDGDPNLGSAEEVGQPDVAKDDSAVVKDPNPGLEKQSSPGYEQEANAESSTEPSGDRPSDAATSGPGDFGEEQVLQPETQETDGELETPCPRPSSHGNDALLEEPEEPTVLTTRPACEAGKEVDRRSPLHPQPGGVYRTAEAVGTTHDGAASNKHSPARGKSPATPVATQVCDHPEDLNTPCFLETDEVGVCLPPCLSAGNMEESEAEPYHQPSVEDRSKSNSATSADVEKLESFEARGTTGNGGGKEWETAHPPTSTPEEGKGSAGDRDEVGEMELEGTHSLSGAVSGIDSEQNGDGEIYATETTEIGALQSVTGDDRRLQSLGKLPSPPGQDQAVDDPHGVVSGQELGDAYNETGPFPSPQTGIQANRSSAGVGGQGPYRHTPLSPSKGGSSHFEPSRDDVGATEMPDRSDVRPSVITPAQQDVHTSIESLMKEIREAEGHMQDFNRQIIKTFDVRGLQEDLRKAQDQINLLTTKRDSLQRELDAQYASRSAQDAQMQEHSQAQEQLREELRQAQSRISSLEADLQRANAELMHAEEKARLAAEEAENAAEKADKNEKSLRLQLFEAERTIQRYQDQNISFRDEHDGNIKNDDNERANEGQGIVNKSLCGMKYIVQIGPHNSVVKICFTRHALESMKAGNKLKAVPKGDHVLFYWKGTKAQSKCGMSIKYDEANHLLKSLKREVLGSLKDYDCSALTDYLNTVFSKYGLQLDAIKDGSLILTFTSPKPDARKILGSHLEEIGEEFVQTFFPERLRRQDILSSVRFELQPDDSVPATPPSPDVKLAGVISHVRTGKTPGSPFTSPGPLPAHPPPVFVYGLRALERELIAKVRIELDDEEEDGLTSDEDGDDNVDDNKDSSESRGTRDIPPSTPGLETPATASACGTSTGGGHQDSDSGSDDSEDEADSSFSSSATRQSDLLAVLVKELQGVKVTWSAKIQDLQKLRREVRTEYDSRRQRQNERLNSLEDRLKNVSKLEVPNAPGSLQLETKPVLPSSNVPGKTLGIENLQHSEHSKTMDFSKLKTYIGVTDLQSLIAATPGVPDPKPSHTGDDGGLYDPDYAPQSHNRSPIHTKISEKGEEGHQTEKGMLDLCKTPFTQEAFPAQQQPFVYAVPMMSPSYPYTEALKGHPYRPDDSHTLDDEKDNSDETLHMSSLGLRLTGEVGPLLKKQEREAGGMILKHRPIVSPSEPFPRISVDSKKPQSPSLSPLPPASKLPQEPKSGARGPDQKEKSPQELAADSLRRERAMVLIQNLGIADRSVAQTNRAATHYVESAYRVLCEEGNAAPRANTMNTILCLDVSESMRGDPWQKVKQVALDLMDGLEEKTETHGLEENVAVVMVGGTGGTVRVLQHLTNDYELARNTINDLPPASGGTPIFEAIIVSIAALEGKGSEVDIGGMHLVKPRIVFVTDGRPTDVKQLSDASQGDSEIKSYLLQLVANLKQTRVGPNPIQWVPVGKADRPFLEGLAKMGDGEVIPPTTEGVASLSKYFLIQDTVAKVYKCMRDIRDRTKKEEWEETTFTVLNALVVPGLSDEDKKHVVEAVMRKLDQPRTGGPLDWDHVTELEGLPPLGRRVVRGPDWEWADQDGGGPGTVVWHEKIDSNPWVWVLWDRGSTNRYHFNSKRRDIQETKDHPARAEEGKPLGIGVQVVRGKDWRSDIANGGNDSHGVVIRVKEDRKVKVRWDNGTVHEHAMEELKPVTPPSATSRPAGNRRQTGSREKHDSPAVSEVPPGHVPVWQWNEDRVTWRTYLPEVQDKLEMEYRKKPQGSCLISRDHVQRRVLFKSNIERPIDSRSTANVCQVRRHVMKEEDYDHALAFELSLG